MTEFEYPREFKGVFIPAEVYLDDRLSPADKILMAEIDSLDHGDGCYASNNYLAAFCRMSLATLKRSLSTLQEAGLIEENGYRGRCRVWRSRLRLSQVPGSKRANYQAQDEPPVIQGGIHRVEQPAPPAAPPADYREKLQKKLEKAQKEGKLSSVLLFGMELMHGTHYSNYPRERKAAARIEQVVLATCNGHEPVRFLHGLVKAYLDRRAGSRSEYWRKAPLSPAGLAARLDETMEHIKDYIESKEITEWIEEAVAKR